MQAQRQLAAPTAQDAHTGQSIVEVLPSCTADRMPSGANDPMMKTVRGHTAAIAVVRGAEHCDCILVVGPVEAVHDQLVCSSYEFEAIVVVELLRDVLPEGVPCSSR